MIDKPLYENPLGGGQIRSGIDGIFDPGAEARRKADEEFLKTADEYQRGFRESEFYKPNAAMTMDSVGYLYKSPTGEDINMRGSSSQIGQFGSYLDSIGKKDLLQRTGGFQSELPQGPGPVLSQDVGSAKPVVNPIVSGPEGGSGAVTAPGVGQDIFGNNPAEIAVPSTANPYNRVGQQLMGPNQDEMLGTLKNIEGGIASLVGNYGQNFNTKQSSNNGNFNNFGTGDFFPPYGGMYG